MSPHPVTHIEIPADDPKDGARFYADVFGWHIQHDETLDYTMFQSDEGHGGGFVTKGLPNAVDRIVPYVETDDIDATLAKVVELGGTVVSEKAEVPGSGHMAMFRDPSGNVIGLWQGM